MVTCTREMPTVSESYSGLPYVDYERVGKKEFEPRHDKTNKMSVRRAKTQISLGIRPV